MLKIDFLSEKLNNEKIKEELVNLCEDNDIVLMALFGSFARGEENKKSDIDLLIKFDENKEKSLLDLIHTENEIKKIFKRKVDLLTLDSISPLLKDDILRSIRVIYERR